MAAKKAAPKKSAAKKVVAKKSAAKKPAAKKASKAAAPVGPYTPVVRAGDWVIVSGQLGLKDGVLEKGVAAQTAQAVVNLKARLAEAGVTIKDVKKRWGNGQEDVYPVAQFEKLWGDMTSLPEANCGFLHVSRLRGQQLKDQAQLDGWLRDGSAHYVEQYCDWES